MNKHVFSDDPAQLESRDWGVVLILAVVGLLLFAPALNHPFVWDDYGLVVGNPIMTEEAGLEQVFTSNILGTKEQNSFYRPLQVLSYKVDRFLWGMNPAGFRFTNIFLHLLSAAAVYFMVRMLSKERLLAGASSLLFLVHPVHTGTVIYISSRADLLAAFFILTTALYYLHYAESNNRSYLFVCWLCFLAALLSKEIALVTPLALAGLHLLVRNRRRLAAIVPLIAVDIVYIGMRWGQEVSGAIKTTLAQRLPGVFIALFEYLRLLIFPSDLHMGYGLRLFQLSDPRVWGGGLIVGGLVAAAWYWRNTKPLIVFAIAWFGVWLLPVLNIYPMNAYMAEHWLYLPSIGFFIVLAAVITEWKKVPRLVSGTIIVILILIYGGLTLRYSALWRDPVTLYQHIIRINPDFVQAYNNLGSVYARNDKLYEAKIYYKKALSMKPWHKEALVNLAKIEEKMGNTEEAQRLLAKALEDAPSDQDARLRMADMLSRQGEIEAARGHYEALRSDDPSNSEALNNEGLLLYRQGKADEAKALYRRAIAARADNKEAINNLANILVEEGRLDEAEGLYAQALAIDSDYTEAINNLGYLYYKRGELGAAMDHYKQALALDPGYVEANINIGLLYFDQGKDGLAQEHVEAALAEAPENLAALNLLGVIHGKNGELKKAEEVFVKILKIDSNYLSAIQNLAKVRQLRTQTDAQ